MPISADTAWFGQTLGASFTTALAGTPYTVDIAAAIACEEAGEFWPLYRKEPSLSLDRILELWAGDPLDANRGVASSRWWPPNC